MCYTGDFVKDPSQREDLGKPLIYLTIASFSVNFSPTIYGAIKSVINKLKRYMLKRKALKELHKLELDNPLDRTSSVCRLVVSAGRCQDSNVT